MRAGLTILGIFLFFISRASNPPGNLFIPVQFTIENGNFNQSKVTVRKDGAAIMTLDGKRNHRLKLEFDSDYIFSFSKPGYITKDIRINTTVPDERELQGFEEYKIGVRLFKQYEGINIVVYNQPVAFICYLPEHDEFGYNVDYTKSILSELTITEALLEQKAKEEAETLSNRNKNKEEDNPVLPNTNAGNTASSPIPGRYNASGPSKVTVLVTDPQKEQGNDQQLLRNNPSGQDQDNKPLIAEGQDIPLKTLPEMSLDKSPENLPVPKPVQPVAMQGADKGNDKPPVSAGSGDDEKNRADLIAFAGADFNSDYIRNGDEKISSREEIVERNRIITTIRVYNGRVTEEFRQVDYFWGARYYFKNRTKSISEHLFQFYTGN